MIRKFLVQKFGRWLLRLFYRVEVHGVENYHAAPSKKVIIANHVSYLDGLLLAVFLPEIPTFAIDAEISKIWWIRPFLKFVSIYPLDAKKPWAIKSLTQLVQKNVPVVIFPEGRLTTTGGVMDVFPGAALLVTKADADFVPVQLIGVEKSYWGHLRGRQELFPKITIVIQPSIKPLKQAESLHETRVQVTQQIKTILNSMVVSR